MLHLVEWWLGLAILLGSCATGAVGGAVVVKYLAPPPSTAEVCERLEALENEQPSYRVAMANLVEQCEDLLDRSERKRRRAAGDVAALARSRGAERDDSEPPVALGDRENMKRQVQLRLMQKGWRP